MLTIDHNERVYILDPQKQRWIVKGRFREALEFQDSVVQLWEKTNFGPMLTIFLVGYLYIFYKFIY